jgi:hypothetical protein
MMEERKKTCQAKLGEADGLVFLRVNIKDKRYLFGNFDGQFILAREDKVKITEGNLAELDAEAW